MGAAVRDIDHGWEALRAEVKRMKGSHTNVGVLAGEMREDDEEVSSMVIVAAANEYGTEDGHVPERSFLRSTFDRLNATLIRVSTAQAKAISGGLSTVERSLRLMGEYFQGEVIRTIRNHPPPANAPSTIAAKGSSGTLIDSAQLAQSIRYEIKVKGAPPVKGPKAAA